MSFEPGYHFVQKYYTTLYERPDAIYQFFGATSSLTRFSEATSEASPPIAVRGIPAIHAYFSKHRSKEYRVALTTSNTMTTLNSMMIVQTVGIAAVQDARPRKFAQTLLLVPFITANGPTYYIQDDLLCWLDDRLEYTQPPAKSDKSDSMVESPKDSDVQLEKPKQQAVSQMLHLDTETSNNTASLNSESLPKVDPGAKPTWAQAAASWSAVAKKPQQRPYAKQKGALTQTGVKDASTPLQSVSENSKSASRPRGDCQKTVYIPYQGRNLDVEKKKAVESGLRRLGVQSCEFRHNYALAHFSSQEQCEKALDIGKVTAGSITLQLLPRTYRKDGHSGKKK